MSDRKKSVVDKATFEAHIVKQRTNHLLVIGIDNYQNGLTKLNNAVRDANRIKDLLIEKYQFDASNVTTLFNEAATLVNIRKVFSEILAKLTEEDNLIFYYSGHGAYKTYGKSKRGYWIPYDATFNEDYTYLANQDINELFKNCRAHHVFGIVDSCYSAALFRNDSTTANDRIDSYPSRWLLTSGRLEIVSDGAMGANSPFAASLITYLENNPNDSLWVSDLCNQVIKGMNYNTEKQTPRGEALQGVGHFGGQLVLYKKGYTPTKEKEHFVNIQKEKELFKNVEKQDFPIPKNLEALKLHLKKLASLDLENALNQFEKYLSKESTMENNLLQQQGMFNRNKKQILDGIISESNARMIENRIRYALLSYIDDLEVEDVDIMGNDSD